MKKLFILMMIMSPLVGCSASIGTPPTTTSTTYTTPVVGEPVVSKTTVTKTTY